jgi:hypothetical protein
VKFLEVVIIFSLSLALSRLLERGLNPLARKRERVGERAL